MLTAPAGRPTPSTISATVSIVSGSFDGGLSTIEQPAAIAGASLWAARFSGKLNGLIAATGPIGNRRVMPTRPFDDGMRSSGIISPVHPLRLFGAEPEGQARAVDLDERIADRLAGLEADQRPISSRRALMPALISRRARPRS